LIYLRVLYVFMVPYDLTGVDRKTFKTT
jgi:hypothetical protein